MLRICYESNIEFSSYQISWLLSSPSLEQHNYNYQESLKLSGPLSGKFCSGLVDLVGGDGDNLAGEDWRKL